jgi:glycosyltransferase involved in cell wall biosynthesis
MIPREQDSTATPVFSIVIPVYEDWIPLGECLQSLARQENAPSFEVIIVDDGCTQAAPESIRSSAHGFPLTIIRQEHAGTPSARNRGIRISKGEALLFVDADCRLVTNCLAALNSTIRDSPGHDYFQLRIVGDCSTVVGRAEELRLLTFQNYMLQPDGRIRYLNTAGFSMRRAKVDSETGVFDPVALRGEDTLLLVNLMKDGGMPLFVPNAIIRHTIQRSLLQCLRKDIRSAYLERRAYDMIALKGMRIRVTHRERLRMLRSMWKTASQGSIGATAWFVLLSRQTLKRIISFGYHCLRVGQMHSPSFF